MPNPQNLVPFQQGDSRINKNGRPKKLITLLKEAGYSADDYKEVFTHIGFQTEDELHNILSDDSKPAILKVIAKAFIKAIEKGDTRYINELLAWAIGKPTESKEVKGEIAITSVEVKVISTGRPKISSERELDLYEEFERKRDLIKGFEDAELVPVAPAKLPEPQAKQEQPAHYHDGNPVHTDADGKNIMTKENGEQVVLMTKPKDPYSKMFVNRRAYDSSDPDSY